MNFFKKHLLSYKYAINGISLSFRFELNMRIHLLAAIAVAALNWRLSVSHTDWILTLLLICVVWVAEMFNTAIEKLSDRVTTEHDLLIGQVKDIASGGVLIACMFAVICGVVIYWGYM